MDKSLLQKHIVGVTKFFMEQGVDISPIPKVMFMGKDTSESITGATGYFDNSTNTIHLFCEGRSAKDILRTYTHELWHKHQDATGELDPAKMGEATTSYTKGNDYLKKIEDDAYLNGNRLLRQYTESLQK